MTQVVLYSILMKCHHVIFLQVFFFTNWGTDKTMEKLYSPYWPHNNQFKTFLGHVTLKWLNASIILGWKRSKERWGCSTAQHPDIASIRYKAKASLGRHKGEGWALSHRADWTMGSFFGHQRAPKTISNNYHTCIHDTVMPSNWLRQHTPCRPALMAYMLYDLM